jgi:23S rRNA (guanosine2251-2'-O)-methyltransferase
MYKKLSMDELGRKSPEDFRESEKFPVVLVLDNIRSMMNTGSVFRTADAFLLEGIYLCGITATPPHREIHKTALGATESVHWQYFEEHRPGHCQAEGKRLPGACPGANGGQYQPPEISTP